MFASPLNQPPTNQTRKQNKRASRGCFGTYHTRLRFYDGLFFDLLFRRTFYHLFRTDDSELFVELYLLFSLRSRVFLPARQ